ncbi:MAG: hypothetical protein PUD46_02800, partial [Subdoligranulum sp.]|nr:hypothetical protein [Subdoligranulum sp.]
IICAFGLASAAPRSPYRHLELCGIALEETDSRGDWPRLFFGGMDRQKKVFARRGGEFNPQSVVGIIGWRAHNVPLPMRE